MRPTASLDQLMFIIPAGHRCRKFREPVQAIGNYGNNWIGQVPLQVDRRGNIFAVKIDIRCRQGVVGTTQPINVMFS